MPLFCGRKATSLTSFLFLYHLLIAIVRRLAVAEIHIIMETIIKKVYKEVVLEAKNAPCGSYAAGCRVNYGDSENCYICDYGG